MSWKDAHKFADLFNAVIDRMMDYNLPIVYKELSHMQKEFLCHLAPSVCAYSKIRQKLDLEKIRMGIVKT